MSPGASLAGLALGLWAAAAGLPTAAQTVYRCGADGRSYAQQPCADGRALALDGDARGAEARSEGEAAASRQSRAAALLENERQRREATAPRRAASLGNSRSGDPSFVPEARTSSGKKPAPGARKGAAVHGRKHSGAKDGARSS